MDIIKAVRRWANITYCLVISFLPFYTHTYSPKITSTNMLRGVALLHFLAGLGAAAHFDVNVGAGGQLKFEPEEISAAQGDTITYHFFSKVSNRKSCAIAVVFYPFFFFLSISN